MSEVRSILERGVAGFEPDPDARDRTLRLVRWRRRRRRLGAVAGAVTVTVALVAGLWSAFRPAPEVDHPHPVAPPEVGRIGGQRPVAAGYGSVWAISCAQRCGNDQRNASGRLLRINPSTGRVVASVAVGQAQAVAVGEGGVWVIDFWRGTVTHVDPQTTRIAAVTPLRLPFSVCRSCPGPRDFLPFDLTTGAGAVWVITDRGAVARIDPATNRVAAYIRIPGEQGGAIAVARDRVWVSIGIPGVWAIDPATNSVVLKSHFVHGSHRVDAGSLEAADGALWASGGNVRRTGNPASPWGLAKGGGAARIDPDTGHLLTTFDFDHPATITAAGDGAVWLSAGTDRTYRIDTRTYAVAGPFSFGGTLWAVTGGTGWVVTADGGIERVPLP